MPIRYVCCQCDTDMTTAVKLACNAAPVPVPTLTLKGMQVVHASGWVMATCPNNHTCSYPCSGDDDGG
jgi:hypothetical protein